MRRPTGPYRVEPRALAAQYDSLSAQCSHCICAAASIFDAPSVWTPIRLMLRRMGRRPCSRGRRGRGRAVAITSRTMPFEASRATPRKLSFAYSVCETASEREVAIVDPVQRAVSRCSTAVAWSHELHWTVYLSEPLTAARWSSRRLLELGRVGRRG